MRRRDALLARQRGLTWDQVAAEVGYTSKGSAYRAAMEAMRDIPREAAFGLRELELERLDALWLGTYTRFVERPSAMAADVLIRIMERRAKLLGLDAPLLRRVDVVSRATLDAEIQRLEAEVSKLDPGPGDQP